MEKVSSLFTRLETYEKLLLIIAVLLLVTTVLLCAIFATLKQLVALSWYVDTMINLIK